MVQRSGLLIVASVALAIPAIAQASDAGVKDEIAAATKTLQQAFADRDTAKIRAMVTADHVSITPWYGRAMHDLAQLETLDELSFSYTFDAPPTITELSAGAVLVTLTQTYDGTFEGRPLDKRVFTTQVWVKRDDRWLQRLYQETAID